MGTRAKSPITLNPVLVRYLEDIEEGQEARLVNENIEPREMFLVFTLIEGEAYPDQHEETLGAFKRYFTKEKILKFPALADFVKKYPVFDKWGDVDVMQIVQTGRHADVVTDKFFPVQVMDFEKLKDFRRRYGKVAQIKKIPAVSPIAKQKTTFKDHRLQTEGLVPHDFRTGKYSRWKAGEIFTKLWERRRHTMKGEAKPLEEGESMTLRNFAAQAGLMESGTPHSPALEKKLIAQIKSVIKNLRRDGYSLEIECSKNSVLLTVED